MIINCDDVYRFTGCLYVWACGSSRLAWSKGRRPPGAISVFIAWTEWTLAMALPWWQHYCVLWLLLLLSPLSVALSQFCSYIFWSRFNCRPRQSLSPLQFLTLCSFRYSTLFMIVFILAREATSLVIFSARWYSGTNNKLFYVFHEAVTTLCLRKNAQNLIWYSSKL